MNVPRLKKGKGLIGPDYYGCCNTGRAPAIYRSHTGKYVVGPDLACDEAIRAGATFTNKRKHGEVMIYKTRKPAVTRFLALCELVLAWNNEQREARRAALERAKAGDVGAILTVEV